MIIDEFSNDTLPSPQPASSSSNNVLLTVNGDDTPSSSSSSSSSAISSMDSPQQQSALVAKIMVVNTNGTTSSNTSSSSSSSSLSFSTSSFPSSSSSSYSTTNNTVSSSSSSSSIINNNSSLPSTSSSSSLASCSSSLQQCDETQHRQQLQTQHEQEPQQQQFSTLVNSSSFASPSATITTTVTSKFKKSSPYGNVIHSHCANCIRPLVCVQLPKFYTKSIFEQQHKSQSQSINNSYNRQQQLTKTTTTTKTAAQQQHEKMIKDSEQYSMEELYWALLNVAQQQQQSYVDEVDFNKVNTTDRCPVVICPNEHCHVILHQCKLTEHYQLCSYQRIPCINHAYGCPFVIQRRNIARHLRRCPAMVMHCAMEWNRWPLHTTEKNAQTRIYCPTQVLDIKNLDVALALRDQRMLKQLWSASRQMKRIMRGCASTTTHPAVPIKPYIGVRTYREYYHPPPPQPQAQDSSSTSPSSSTPYDHQKTSTTIMMINGDMNDDGKRHMVNINADTQQFQQPFHNNVSSEQQLQSHQSLQPQLIQSLPEVLVIHYDEECYIMFAENLINTAYHDALGDIMQRTATSYRNACTAVAQQRKKYNYTQSLVSSTSSTSNTQSQQQKQKKYQHRKKSNSICTEMMLSSSSSSSSSSKMMDIMIMNSGNSTTATPLSCTATFPKVNTSTSTKCFFDSQQRRQSSSISPMMNGTKLCTSSLLSPLSIEISNNVKSDSLVMASSDTAIITATTSDGSKGGGMKSLPSSSSINLPVVSDSILAELEASKLAAAATSISSDCHANGTINGDGGGGKGDGGKFGKTWQLENSSNQHHHSLPPPPPPPVPKCNALSLEISIRSLAIYHPKPRAMYTFRCGTDYRVDEYCSHFRDIHANIHGGLDGWIEHRCPLFQYGCNFVHRRWSPNVPTPCDSLPQQQLNQNQKKKHYWYRPRTLVYNETLETFACPMINDDDNDDGVNGDGDNDDVGSRSSQSRSSNNKGTTKNIKSEFPVSTSSYSISTALSNSLSSSMMIQTAASGNKSETSASSPNSPNDSIISNSCSSSSSSCLCSCCLSSSSACTCNPTNTTISASSISPNSSAFPLLSPTSLSSSCGNNKLSCLPLSSSYCSTKPLLSSSNTISNVSSLSSSVSSSASPTIASTPVYDNDDVESTVMMMAEVVDDQEVLKEEKMMMMEKDNTPTTGTTAMATALKCSSSQQQQQSLLSLDEVETIKPMITLDKFPAEILLNICSYLDGYTLNMLSFTCHRLREAVQNFLKHKGFVSLQWKRYEVDKGKYRWTVASKRWMFSTAIAPIDGWSIDSNNIIGEHLRWCPFNERNEHQHASSNDMIVDMMNKFFNAKHQKQQVEQLNNDTSQQ